AFLFSCYNLSLAADAQRSLAHTAGAVALTSLIYLLIPYLTPALPTSRWDIFAFPLLGMAGIAVWRGVYAAVLVQPHFHPRILVVGAGWAGQTLVRVIHELDLHPHRRN